VGRVAGKRFVGLRVWLAQLVVFSALGWVLAGIIDGAGTLPLRNALFAAGLSIAVVAALIFLQANDMVAFRLGAATRSRRRWAGSDRPIWGVSVDRFEALAVISSACAAVGLIVGAALVG